jgi:hypothetical protein
MWWRARANDAAGKPGNWSAIRRFVPSTLNKRQSRSDQPSTSPAFPRVLQFASA